MKLDFSALLGGQNKKKPAKKEPTVDPDPTKSKDPDPNALTLDKLLATMHNGRTAGALQLPDGAKLSASVLTDDNLKNLVKTRTPKLPPELLEAHKQNPEEALPHILSHFANSIYGNAIKDAALLQEASIQETLKGLGPQIEKMVEERSTRSELGKGKPAEEKALHEMFYGLIREQNRDMPSTDASAQASKLVADTLAALRNGQASSEGTDPSNPSNVKANEEPTMSIADFWGVELPD